MISREAPRAFAAGNNEFAVALYAAIDRGAGNFLVSPFSVGAALGMASLGARGATAAEMGAVLRQKSAGEPWHEGFASIVARNHREDGGCELRIACRPWSQTGAPFLPEFARLTAERYRSDAAQADFARAADAAAAEINRWVAEATKNQIRDLVPPGALNALTRLVLVNALYFQASWILWFDESDTRSEPFHLESGEPLRVPTMTFVEEVRYHDAGDYHAVDLEYFGCDVTMLILLPKSRGRLPELERKLSAELLDACVARLEPRRVDLSLPRFRVRWGSADLTSALQSLGLKLAFDRERADFSGINDAGPGQAGSLFVSSVLHQAFVEVDENGTTAGAASEVSMGTLSKRAGPPPEPRIFRADHPFLFAIRDRISGAILFLGRVTNPLE